jgi:hypothetical protein
MPQWLTDAGIWIAQNLGWSITQRTLVTLVMTAVLTAGLDRAFGLLGKIRQKIWFFVVSSLIGLFLITTMGSKPTSSLDAQVYYIGVSSGITPPVAFITVGIVNSGSVQSIAYGFNLTTVMDGRTYFGLPVTIPDKMVFNIAGRAVEYVGSDSIVVKSSTPIPPGGETSGVAVFRFNDLPANLLGRPGPFTLHFVDAFGNSYSSVIELRAVAEAPNMDLPGLQQRIAPIPSVTPTVQQPNPSPTVLQAPQKQP